MALDRKSKELWLDSWKGQQICSCQKHPHQLWSLVGRGVYINQDLKLNTDFHPMPKLRMSDALSPLHHMPSWCAQGQLHLYNLT